MPGTRARVGGVGRHGGHQCDRIRWYRAGAQVDEAPGKAGPAVDLGEQFGNPDAWQYAVEVPCDIIYIRVVLWIGRIDNLPPSVIMPREVSPPRRSVATSRSRCSGAKRRSSRQAVKAVGDR
jgi:hypothetical protein